MIRSTDTDVLVLAVATLEDLKELWVSYETGKNPNGTSLRKGSWPN